MFELFSKRNKPKKEVEVYKYNELPNPFRVQVIYIWQDLFGQRGDTLFNIIREEDIYKSLVEILARDFGVFYLHLLYRNDRYGYQSEFTNGFLEEKSVNKTLDYIELTFRIVNNIIGDEDYQNRVVSYKYDAIVKNAVTEINHRFDEHNLGYQIVDGMIVRRDNTFTHQEIIKPSLEILARQRFKGASVEFHKAHEHYRKGNHHEALNECLKAFESTMRIICDKQGWQVKSNATAKILIDACFDNGLIPQFWQSKFASLRGLLESGVPTARNKLSGHGAGSEEKEIPRYLVEYALNITASSILFLVSAEESL